jgi:hypothetical protein
LGETFLSGETCYWRSPKIIPKLGTEWQTCINNMKITPWSTVLLERQTIAQPVNKLLA